MRGPGARHFKELVFFGSNFWFLKPLVNGQRTGIWWSRPSPETPEVASDLGGHSGLYFSPLGLWMAQVSQGPVGIPRPSTHPKAHRHPKPHKHLSTNLPHLNDEPTSGWPPHVTRPGTPSPGTSGSSGRGGPKRVAGCEVGVKRQAEKDTRHAL